MPVLTPHLSSLWVGLVTPVDTGVARPLIEGLSHETVVTDPSGMAALPARERIPLDQALREAVAEMDEKRLERREGRFAGGVFAEERDQDLVGELGEQARQVFGAAGGDLDVDAGDRGADGEVGRREGAGVGEVGGRGRSR